MMDIVPVVGSVPLLSNCVLILVIGGLRYATRKWMFIHSNLRRGGFSLHDQPKLVFYVV